MNILKAQKRAAELALQYTDIKAPIDGTVSNKKVEVGMMVQPGSPLFVVVPHDVWVVANYKETQLTHMKEGMDVDIKIDTYPDHVFKGKIDSIQRSSGAKASLFPPENAVGSFVKIVQRIPVKIVFTEQIDPSEYSIIPGMSVVPKVRIRDFQNREANCSITTQRRHTLSLLPPSFFAQAIHSKCHLLAFFINFR